MREVPGFWRPCYGYGISGERLETVNTPHAQGYFDDISVTIGLLRKFDHRSLGGNKDPTALFLCPRLKQNLFSNGLLDKFKAFKADPGCGQARAIFEKPHADEKQVMDLLAEVALLSISGASTVEVREVTKLSSH